MERIEIQFEGEGVRDHLVSATGAGDALGGICTAIYRAAFLVENETARFKGPYSENVKILVGAPERGSVLFPIFVNVVGSVAAAAVIGAAQYLFTEAVGRRGNISKSPLDKIAPGTVASSVESVESPIKKAHNVIYHGDVNININFNNQGIIQFNNESASYLKETTLVEEPQQSVMVVSSMSANDRSGRVFNNELGRNVTFKLAKEISQNSVDLLMSSFRRYFSNFGGADVLVHYYKYVSVDGKVKKITIFQASEIV